MKPDMRRPKYLCGGLCLGTESIFYNRGDVVFNYAFTPKHFRRRWGLILSTIPKDCHYRSRITKTDANGCNPDVRHIAPAIAGLGT